MIKGEYLTADDLGPLGRLVAPGDDMLVLEPRDVKLVRMEREWVGRLYREADRKAEALRKRLRGARQGPHGAVVRERFEDWTVEAAKLALCDHYLLVIIQQLDSGQRQALNPNKQFRWDKLDKIQDVTRRVLDATDGEIEGGTVFRAK